MKLNTYTTIFNVLRDLQWHNKSEFCRPYSQDDRRLRDMHLSGWIDYDKRLIRKDKKILYTEYRITEIRPSWWEYSSRFGIVRQETQKDLFAKQEARVV